MPRRTRITPTQIKEAEKMWLTMSEAAKYLGVGIDFLKRLKTSGKLSWYKVGRYVFFKKADIDRLIQRNCVCRPLPGKD